MSINQIVEGTVNNIFNKKQDLFEIRIEICKKCKLYKLDSILGPICNRSIYINPKTDEISRIPLAGFSRGCGCLLASKCRVKEAVCPVGKW